MTKEIKNKVFILILLIIIILMIINIFSLNKTIKSQEEIISSQKYDIGRLEMIRKEIYELFINCVESQE